MEERLLTVVHHGEPAQVLELLAPLRLGAAVEATSDATAGTETAADPSAERRTLRWVLAINATMFVGELVLGLIAQSTGLVADSLDMLADAMVYGLSLAAVGGTLSGQRRAARVSGWLQVVLAIGVITDVARRAVTGSNPTEAMMISVAAAALAANLACVALLSRHRHGGVHLRASWIFTTTDALANLGVIVAGVLVRLTGSPIPDLVAGTLIALLVLSGAARILRLR